MISMETNKQKESQIKPISWIYFSAEPKPWQWKTIPKGEQWKNEKNSSVGNDLLAVKRRTIHAKKHTRVILVRLVFEPMKMNERRWAEPIPHHVYFSRESTPSMIFIQWLGEWSFFPLNRSTRPQSYTPTSEGLRIRVDTIITRHIEHYRYQDLNQESHTRSLVPNQTKQSGEPF